MRTNSAGLLRFHWLKALSMAGHAGTSPPTYANEVFAAFPNARTLHLDLYLPAHRRPSPLLIWIHGGAWLHGDKEEPPVLPFLHETYALASIEYHFSHEATFPRQLHTCKAAVRWLRAHAQDLGYIADRIGVLGASAGGHLASCLGASNCNAEMEGTIGLHLQESSSVQAVVDLFGPTDFIHMLYYESSMDHSAPDSPESLLLGGTVLEVPDKVAAASPITHISVQTCPFLIVHGEQDPLIPWQQSELLRDALLAQGVPVEFQLVKGAGHGGPAISNGSAGPIRKFLQRTILLD